MTKTCIVICEEESAASLSLISEMVRMTAGYGREVNAVILHGDGRRCFACGVSHVYTLELKETFADEAELACHLAVWFRKQDPETVVANATVRLRGLMPMIAARLGCGLTADCTALEFHGDGSLLQIRPALGGQVTAGIVSSTWPQMATVRPGIFPLTVDMEQDNRGGGQNCRVPERLHFPMQELVTCMAYHKSDQRNTLADAKIIVAGGAGIGSRQGFELLEKLAARLNGCAGATRSAVGLNYAPYSCQIGQTGQIVRPKIYLAIGISGAVQHVVGMNGAETVIAINSDPSAPIFDYADYGMAGDWNMIVEQLLGHLT